jgi:hypothetical protein
LINVYIASDSRDFPLHALYSIAYTLILEPPLVERSGETVEIPSCDYLRDLVKGFEAASWYNNR